MLLAVNIGNSNIRFGVFGGKEEILATSIQTSHLSEQLLGDLEHDFPHELITLTRLLM